MLTVKQLQASHSWAILTAENPGGVRQADAVNEYRRNALRCLLDDSHYTYEEVTGTYGGNTEKAVLIYRIHPEKAAEIGRTFEQEAILTARGLLFLETDQWVTTKGIKQYSSIPSDNYTKLANGEIFASQLNF